MNVRPPSIHGAVWSRVVWPLLEYRVAYLRSSQHLVCPVSLLDSSADLDVFWPPRKRPPDSLSNNAWGMVLSADSRIGSYIPGGTPWIMGTSVCGRPWGATDSWLGLS